MVTLEDLGVSFDDVEPDNPQWGGNRRLSFLKRKLLDPCYEVQDVSDGSICHGPLGIDVVTWLLDWKSR